MSENVTPTITDRDFTIATIATPAALRSDDADSDGDDAEGDEETGEEEAASEDE